MYVHAAQQVEEVRGRTQSFRRGEAASQACLMLVEPSKSGSGLV